MGAKKRKTMDGWTNRRAGSTWVADSFVLDGRFCIEIGTDVPFKTKSGAKRALERVADKLGYTVKWEE